MAYCNRNNNNNKTILKKKNPYINFGFVFFIYNNQGILLKKMIEPQNTKLAREINTRLQDYLQMKKKKKSNQGSNKLGRPLFVKP